MLKKLWKHYIKGMKDQQGSSAIEFALVAPIFFLIAIGGIEFMIVTWEKYSLNYAVSLAAREAFVYPDKTDAEIEEYINENMPTPLPDTPTYTIEIIPNDQVTITATLNHTFIFFSSTPITITSTIVQPLTPAT